MRREPSLTLRGALAILGHHDRRLIDRLDKLLGGVILAAGAGAGLAALKAPMLAPAAALAPVWGWLEQKNEALALLREAQNTASEKLMGTAGFERRQLIMAAHTTIVAAAFFESFQDYVPANLRKKVRISNAKKVSLITGRQSSGDESIISMLYNAEIPAPSSARGYEENITAIESWLSRFCNMLAQFLNESAMPKMRGNIWPKIRRETIERYRSYYLVLAAAVPEFAIWAMLGEHAATRSEIIGLRSDVTAALDANKAGLGRVEALLALQTGEVRDALDLCKVVARANRGVLDQPIVHMDTERYGTAVQFPLVRQIYVNSNYRIARADEDARPADENWWDYEQLSRDDLDLTLAACMTVPDATRLPVLLLGHPGAGKSLLTKVIAARLPMSAFTVVRVPLRQVGANAPIMDQIQQALDLSTHRRVNWWELAEQSRGTMRVILLDGLDELLQATNNDRSSYLQEIMEFQRIEAEQEQPVIVIVTSRTVVADRVDIPSGATIIKLDHFEEKQIAEWLAGWREANASLIASGKVRALTMTAARRHYDLAQQPLLLLMLALYSADPSSAPLDADLSSADLYHRLLDNFARREVAKKSDHKLSDEELEGRIREQLERLSIAALAMFNRGRQDITEMELSADLEALHHKAPVPSSYLELGRRLIGEFFFVHAAEAHPTIGSGSAGDISGVLKSSNAEPPRRCYEFLHATFSEYLVASRIMAELVDIAEAAFSSPRGRRELDDNLLFALLCHRPLAVRTSTLSFAMQIFTNLSNEERQHALAALEILVSSYRHRHGSDLYVKYEPQKVDTVRQLASYSANLVSLRVALEAHADIPLERMFGFSANTMEQWRSTATLWRAGLDTDGLLAVLGILRFADRSLKFSTGKDANILPEVWFAQLIGESKTAENFQYGMAINDSFIAYEYGDRVAWDVAMSAWLIPAVVGITEFMPENPIINAPPPGTPESSVRRVAQLVMKLLWTRGCSYDVDRHALRFLFDLQQTLKIEIDKHALWAVMVRHPKVLESIPEMRDPMVYGGLFDVLFIAFDASAKRTIMQTARSSRLHPVWMERLEKSPQQASFRDFVRNFFEEEFDAYIETEQY